jgi:beta-lactamase regulating signal transducer with metallopeptidase domain
MNLLQIAAQISVERSINALPEGILIAVFAWALLRILRKQNSETRFAVWFLALLAVVGLPLLAAFSGGGSPILTVGLSSSLRPAITLPGPWALVVLSVWAVGVMIALAKLAAGFWRVLQLRRSCAPIAEENLDPAVRKTLEAIRGRKSAAKAITIAASECVRVPAAVGFWKPTIILPAWTLQELPANDLNAILLHEFAHLRRRDDWTNLIQKIVRALFFFHPAVWWIEKQLSVEREMACDDAVIAETANPHGYATCLVSLLEKGLAHRLSQPQWSMIQAAVNRAREASIRLAQILDTNRPVATRVWKPAVGMIGGFAVICLMVLPLAPQFVAFDRGVVRNSNVDYSSVAGRPSLQSSLRGPAVVPAAFRTRESSASVQQPKVPGKVRRAARVTVRREHEVQAQLVQSKVGVESIAPQYQTLVFIEAAQYGSLDSPVWSVQVWRVTFVSAVHQRMAKVPAANSI